MNKRHIPNLLTFARVAIVPVVLVLAVVFPRQSELILWLFVAAALTDFFDGYLARKWNVVSPLGTMLDPIADKLLVVVVLLYLLEYTIAPLLAVALIIAREIYIAGLREFLALRGVALPVSRGGKWKTALQLLALTAMLVAVAYRLPQAWFVGVILLWASALLSLISSVLYTRSAIKALR